MRDSTLFFQNLTCIDHATLTPQGVIEGGSFHCSVSVTGHIEEVEQVVVDFSTLKKSIKELIDDKLVGFDHKLWVEQSDVSYVSGKRVAIIDTPYFNAIVPVDAIKIVDYDVGIEEEIKKYLDFQLNLVYPDSGLVCQIWLNTQKATSFLMSGEDDLAMPFRYVHGLKNSSSWGCQNINHGHLSYMGLIDFNGIPIDLNKIPEFQEYKNVVFIWDDNLVKKTSDKITIAYETDRGMFIVGYNTQQHHCIFSKQETTVENLAALMVERHGDLMRTVGGYYFYITEGLAKGSMVTL